MKIPITSLLHLIIYINGGGAKNFFQEAKLNIIGS